MWTFWIQFGRLCRSFPVSVRRIIPQSENEKTLGFFVEKITPQKMILRKGKLQYRNIAEKLTPSHKKLCLSRKGLEKTKRQNIPFKLFTPEYVKCSFVERAKVPAKNKSRKVFAHSPEVMLDIFFRKNMCLKTLLWTHGMQLRRTSQKKIRSAINNRSVRKR